MSHKAKISCLGIASERRVRFREVNLVPIEDVEDSSEQKTLRFVQPNTANDQIGQTIEADMEGVVDGNETGAGAEFVTISDDMNLTRGRGRPRGRPRSSRSGVRSTSDADTRPRGRGRGRGKGRGRGQNEPIDESTFQT